MSSPLPKNLKSLRFESGLKQEELAEKLEIKPKSWSNYERGENEPDIGTLLKIANYFGITLDSLVSRDISPIAKNLNEGNPNIQKRVSKNTKKGIEKGNPKGNLTMNEPELEYNDQDDALNQTLKNLVTSKEEVIELLRARIKELEKALSDCNQAADKSHA